MVRIVFLFLAVFTATVPVYAQHPTNAEVLEELNFARTKPQEYAQILREYRKHFKGNIVYEPGKENALQTNEGVAAVDEAIAFLERAEPVPPLFPSPILKEVAADHVKEQGPRGTYGHASADGSNPSDRLARRGGGHTIGETIAYGPITSARDLVRQLIVDDGVPDRGHRDLIFQSNQRFAGTTCGYHKQLFVMCVTDYSYWVDGNYRAPAKPRAAPPPPAQ